MQARPKKLGRRRRLGRAIAEMHFQLRTGRDSPASTAFAIWVGTIVGCTPLWGLHLAICVGLTTLLRLSPVKAYLAAHINNPLTAPVLFYIEAGVGHWLFTGKFLPLSFAEWRAVGFMAFGRDLLVGSLAVGFVIGAVLALVAYVIQLRAKDPDAKDRLIETMAKPYLESGIFAWEFVRGKLRFDPVYFDLLSQGALPDRGKLVDLGCGRGLLLSALRVAATTEGSDWPEGWKPAPKNLELIGVDGRPHAIETARTALGDSAELHCGDLTRYDIPSCSAVVLINVLHYLDAQTQERLLARAADALQPGGLLVLCEGDAAPTTRFLITRLAERFCAVARGDFRQHFHFRSVGDWRHLVESLGLETATRPASDGTPYANIWIAARKPDSRASSLSA